MKKIICPKCHYEIELENIESEEINKIVKDREKEIKEKLEAEYKLALSKSMQEKENDKNILADQLKEKISSLENELKIKDAKSETEKVKAVSEKDKEILQLKNEIEKITKEKDIQIEYYKDLKTKASTKMLGENLEQHCMNSFNMYRATSYPNAYFDKDNEVSKESGSKGDFIFRDRDSDGNEYISIMFEMKNESDTTSTKKKNEDFLKELNKDRNEKKCEYAVLVSLLEPESDLYNGGIVDVSYLYPKMYVVRPQCFLSIISILTNAARNSLGYQKQLIEYKEKNIDMAHFEENFNNFKEKFTRNCRLASEKFEKSLKEIDAAIENLKKMKENLIGCQNNILLADKKAQNVSIKKLTSKTKIVDDDDDA